MTTYHHGWLYIEDGDTWAELFNHARTAAYLSSAAALGCGKVYNVLDDGGCEAYRWAPLAQVLTDSDGEPLYDEETEQWLTDADLDVGTGWVELDFTSPELDPAPWYNSSFPESADAIGFWVQEWTGLDSGVIQRPMETRGAYGGGGSFGVLSSTGREMTFEVILLGQSEAALDYLYRWLDATLASVCSTCTTDTIAIRRTCPTVDPENLESVINGVVEMRQVGLISGLTWANPPVEREGCFIRAVNFTLGALDPCMYGWCTDIEVAQVIDWVECFTYATPYISPDRLNCRPSCSEMSGECRTVFNYTVDDPSASAPVIELTPPASSGQTIPVRIRTYANPLGLLPDELCGAPLLGELYVDSLPEWTTLRYDVAGRKVEIRNPGSSDFFNGFGYLQPNDPGVPRFFSLGCGDFTTIVEPADFCYADDYTDQPDATLAVRTRMNCA